MKPKNDAAAVRPIRAALLLVACLVLAGLSPSAQDATAPNPLSQKLPQRFTTIATNMNAGIGSLVIELTITRWSSDAERDLLFGILKEKGPEEMLKVLRRQKSVGRIATPSSIGEALSFATQEQTANGGRDIILIGDRTPDFAEIASSSPSTDYQFTYIELHMKSNNTGTGELLPAARLSWGGKLLLAENYNPVPVLLGSVKLER